MTIDANDLQSEHRAIGAERRRRERYPLDGEIRFRTLSKRSGYAEGVGNALNMSSGGMLFTTQTPLKEGVVLELAISWPARLDGRCGLKMMARGRVIRYRNGTAAVTLHQHEFRTMGNKGLTL